MELITNTMLEPASQPEFNKRQFYRKAFKMILPIVVQNLFSAMISSTDVIMLNAVGQSSISAVSLASNITSMLFMFFYGLSAGVTMLCSQYYGKRDMKAINVVEGIALRFTLGISLLFALSAFFAPRFLMQLFTDDEELIVIGIDYLRIVAFSYLLWGIMEVYIAVLKSVGRVAICTVLNLIAFVSNIFLNAVFIFGLFGMPRLGAAGVALGTTIARFLQLICCFIISAKSKDVKLKFSFLLLRNKLLFRDFIRLSLPALLNDVIWGLAFTCYSAIIGHLDSDAVAAYSIVMVVRNFGTVLCFAVGSATGILLGNLLGENKLRDAEKGSKILLFLTVLCGAVGGLIVLTAMPFVVSFADITEQARHYLKIMMLINVYYIMGTAVNTTMITGIFRSGGDSRFGFVCDLIDMWGYAVPLGLLTAFVLKLPVLWVYFFLCTDEFVKWPWVFHHYKSKKWLKNITRDNL